MVACIDDSGTASRAKRRVAVHKLAAEAVALVYALAAGGVLAAYLSLASPTRSALLSALALAAAIALQAAWLAACVAFRRISAPQCSGALGRARSPSSRASWPHPRGAAGYSILPSSAPAPRAAAAPSSALASALAVAPPLCAAPAADLGAAAAPKAVWFPALVPPGEVQRPPAPQSLDSMFGLAAGGGAGGGAAAGGGDAVLGSSFDSAASNMSMRALMLATATGSLESNAAGA